MPKINSHGLRPRQNVTVVPLDFNSPSTIPTSPRNHSKTKLKLVSPSVRNSSLLKENHPPKITPQELSKQRSSAQIQLGGKVDHTSRYQPNRQSGDVSQINSIKSTTNCHSRTSSRNILVQSTYEGSGKERTYPYSPMKPTSPARISIHYHSKNTLPSQHKPTFTCPTQQLPNEPKTIPNYSKVGQAGLARGQLGSVSQKSLGKGGQVSLSNFPSDFAIKEENSLQNLKESYEGEMNQIKKLQEEITSNNQQIRQLLQSSKASSRKKQSSSKGIGSKEGEKQLNLAESRTPSIWNTEEGRGQFQEVPPVLSKRTLINDLKIQTENKIEGQMNARRSNEEVSVQTDSRLPVESIPSQQSVGSEKKVRRLSMVKNQECQVQVISTSETKIQRILNNKNSENSPKNSLKGSIVHDINSSEEKDSEKKSEGNKSLELIKSRKTPGRISQQKIEVTDEKLIQKAELCQSIKASQTIAKEDKFPFTEQNICSPIPVSQQLLPQADIPEKVVPQKQTAMIPTRPGESVTRVSPPKPRDWTAGMGRKIYNKIYL